MLHHHGIVAVGLLLLRRSPLPGFEGQGPGEARLLIVTITVSRLDGDGGPVRLHRATAGRPVGRGEDHLLLALRPPDLRDAQLRQAVRVLGPLDPVHRRRAERELVTLARGAPALVVGVVLDRVVAGAVAAAVCRLPELATEKGVHHGCLRHDHGDEVFADGPERAGTFLVELCVDA